MVERIDGVLQGFKLSTEAFARAAEQAVLGVRHALYGYDVQECRWLEVDQVVRTERTLYAHPIFIRMLMHGEDRATATLAWKLDELEAWALRRHDTRCNIAQRRGEARADRALVLHETSVQRMRVRWASADLHGVPYVALRLPKFT